VRLALWVRKVLAANKGKSVPRVRKVSRAFRAFKVQKENRESVAKPVIRASM
jgi:hypothetical protein